MGYYINASFGYYEGDPLSEADTAVPQRPGPSYQWIEGVWSIPLAAAQAAQIALLEQDYQAQISTPVSFKNAAGVTSTYPPPPTVCVNGKTVEQNLQDIIDAGSAAWTLGFWLDSNGVAQTFTFADIQGLVVAFSAVETADYKTLLQQIAAVQAAQTVAAVQEITW